MKTYYLPINQEVCNYLQRLDYEIKTCSNVITKLLTQTKDDSDASVLDGIPFKTYHKKLEEAEYSYQTAKDELSSQLTPIVQEKENNKNISFNWIIEDFHNPQVKITVLDPTSCNSCDCKQGE